MHTLHKTLLITASLLLIAGAGCTQSTTNQNANQNSTGASNVNGSVDVNSSSDALVLDNTNTEQGDETTNTNTVVENTNAEVSDTNTNAADDPAVDTSDWLTYTNEEYGFSFRYPSDYLVSTNDANIVTIEDRELLVYGKISVETSDSFLTMAEQEILMVEPGKETMPLIDESFLTVNTLPTYRSLRQLNKGDLLHPNAPDSTELTEQTWTEVEYRYIGNGNLLRLSFNIEGENYQNYYDVIDTIGQSFRMPAVNTSDWLTYEDARVGLKFKHPSLYDNKSVSYSDCSESVTSCDGSQTGESYIWMYTDPESDIYYSVAGASTKGFSAGRGFRFTDAVQYLNEGDNYSILLPDDGVFEVKPAEVKQTALGSAIMYSVSYLPSYPMMSDDQQNDSIVTLNFDKPVNEFNSVSFYVYEFMTNQDIDLILQSIEIL